MNLYLIRNDKHVAHGRYPTVEAADIAAAHKQWDYSVIGDADDLANLYTVAQLVSIYNAAVEESRHVKDFKTKTMAAERAFAALEEVEKFRTPRAPKERSTAPTAPHGSGYKGHRVGSRKEKMHQWLDEHPDASREDFAAECDAINIKPSTANSWYHAFKAWKPAA